MTAPRVQCHFWQRRRSVFFFFLILGGAQTDRGVTKVPDTLQRWWLYARDLKSFWTDSSCLVLALKLCYHRVEQSARKFARNTQRGAELVNPGKKSLVASVWMEPGPSPGASSGVVVFESVCALRLSLLHNKQRWQQQIRLQQSL